MASTEPVAAYWAAARRALCLSPDLPAPPAWHFCDTESAAETCLALVLAGRKRATAPSVAELEAAGQPLPRPGDLDIITGWAGDPACLIETVSAEIVPFEDVPGSFAKAEGEGDGTLAWWRDAHSAYYARVLEGTGQGFAADMPIVMQHFRVVHRRV